MKRVAVIVGAFLAACGGGGGGTPSGRYVQPARIGTASDAGLVVRADVDAGGGDAGAVPKAPPRFTKIAVGDAHSCALTREGDAWCWGRVGAESSEIAVGRDLYVPRRMDVADVIDVAISGASTCFLHRDGAVSCQFVSWPVFAEEGHPEWPSFGTVPHGVSIAVSGLAVCVLDAAGLVQCGGLQMPLAEVATLPRVARLFSRPSRRGESSFCAVTADLRTSCFEVGKMDAPIDVPGFGGVEQLATWDDEMCGVKSDGSYVCRGQTRVVDEKKLAAIGPGATLLSGPGAHCAIGKDARLSCWNEDGTTKRRLDIEVELPTPDEVGPVMAAAVGLRHACVVRPDGQAACWGATRHGETGTGVALSRHVAVRVDLPEAMQVTATYEDSCALLADGSVRCWGHNPERLQNGGGAACEPTVDEREPRCPTPVVSLGPGEAAEIAGTEPLCLRARAGGPFRCMSRAPHGYRELTGIPGGSANVVSYLPYGYAATVRTGDGRLFHTKDFLIGNETGPMLPAFAPLAWAKKGSWKAVSQDGRCAIDDQDRVRCACEADDHRHRSESCGPKDLTFTLPTLTGAKEVLHMPNNDVCALFADGHVKCARDIPLPADLVRGRIVPAADELGMASLSNVVALRGSALFESGGVGRGPVYAGYDGTACAITSEGAVFCWGASSHGEVGFAGLASPTKVPHKIDGLPPVKDVAVGAHHACALTRDKQVYCWGDDESGQLGQGTPARIPTPTPVKL